MWSTLKHVMGCYLSQSRYFLLGDYDLTEMSFLIFLMSCKCAFTFPVILETGDPRIFVNFSIFFPQGYPIWAQASGHISLRHPGFIPLLQ